MAWSSASIGWTWVSPQQLTSTGRTSLPMKLRAISMQWQPRSMIAPPPESSLFQNQSLCGPEWVSRERTQRILPSAPLADRFEGLECFGRVAEVFEVAVEDAGPFDRLGACGAIRRRCGRAAW